MKMKKSFLIAAAIVATMSLSSASVFATESPVPSASVVSSNPGGMHPMSDYLAVDNAKLNNGGNSWSHKSGFNYGRIYITNASSQTLTVYLSYRSSSGDKINIGTWHVSGNDTLTLNTTNAGGQTFYLDYNTPNGTVSGNVNVRASDVPL
ncbi:hypothetical protein [Paenibacillus graminis]|uniref:hypothetical protein n=1 Tax=Paenibacillus graminis TaxID=189425 RepID=UPI002DBF28A1|nr:hypothetical protein [Paenibacillus graminis]MEC0170856.1 hypothetical protein [Paenibacillus graminis]